MRTATLTLFIALILSPFISSAQVRGGEFNKLFDMYLLEDYTGCLDQAMKMSEKDKYRRHPEPLLYIAMCYYQLSLDPEATATEEFEDAYKDALKYAYKAVKKDDEEYNLISQNRQFIEDLKVRGAEEGRFFYNEDDFRKAASTYARILKIDEDDPGILLMTGVCQLLSKNIGEGQKNVDRAMELIKTKFDDDSYEPSEVTYNHVVDGLIIYSNYLVDSGEKEKAKDVISAGRTAIPKDDNLKLHYEKLVY